MQKTVTKWQSIFQDANNSIRHVKCLLVYFTSQCFLQFSHELQKHKLLKLARCITESYHGETLAEKMKNDGAECVTKTTMSSAVNAGSRFCLVVTSQYFCCWAVSSQNSCLFGIWTVFCISSTMAILMPMTHAPETGTKNLYQKTGTIFRTQFFVPDETGSKISGLIFLYYCPSNSF